jgi:pimeloyl-ACP methyl ester carboxylesterase
MIRRAVRVLAVVLLPGALAIACGGGGKAAPSGSHENPLLLSGGKLVSIGGGRSLYIKCMGSGSPTVVLEAGFGGNTDNWADAQPQLGRITRTCAYDRAGLGNSVAMPGVHTASDEIADLQSLLEHARIAPPYVIVGHSYGGLLARLFAKAHPTKTAGVVLIDSMGQAQDRRELGFWRSLPPRLRRRVPKPDYSNEYGVDLRAGVAQATRIGTLDATPLAVVTAGRDDPGGGAVPAAVRHGLRRLWNAMQDQLAALSSDHLHVFALRSGHFIQGADGQPDVVVAAVRAVVQAARHDTRLPACPAVFSGPGVKCAG